MHRNHPAEPLKILVVTEDRALQRQLSQFFDMMGYQALQAADANSAQAAVQAQRPHVMLLGSELAARADWELCRALTLSQNSAGAFTFLLIDESDEGQLHDALEAGIDDFLLKPIGYGELLSRLRAAARVLEFDQRATQQGRADATTGLLSRSAVVAKLRSLMAQRARSSARVSCIVLDLDFFARINHLQGPAAGNTLLQAVAQELNSLRNGTEILGCLGADRFCVVLPGSSDSAATDWAEHARHALAATKFKLGETTWQITASFGVAGCDAAESGEQIVERATQALEIAKSSGRNCVVRCGEFGPAELELTPPGKLLERTVAREVMTPCTVFLQPGESVGQAVELLHRTRLDGIPVVDPDGKLLGLCEQDNLVTVSESQYATRTVRDWMTSEVQSFDEHDSLASLLDFLARDPRSLVIVVNEGRPVGFVTRDSLLAMSQRVTTSSFAPQDAYSDGSEYLLVPDLAPVECDHTT